MLHSVVTVDEAIAMGVCERKAYRYAEVGTWLKLQSGIFLTDPTLVDDAFWKAELAAMLLHGGERALVSHRSAAVLHGLEGVSGRHKEITVPLNGTRRPKGAHRTRLVDGRSQVIDGLRTTSLARTILDLATVCTPDVVEQALESALRGPDRWRPDVWNTDLLAELRQLVKEQNSHPGLYILRVVLSRRSDSDRPTGSFPETVFFQALRAAGLVVVRQPTLRIVDRNGANLDILFPDFAVLWPIILLEVDGVEAHSSESSLARDLNRQNKLSLVFPIRRFTAMQILSDPVAAAQEIVQLVSRLQNSGTPTIANITVSYKDNEFLVADTSRDAKQEALLRGRAGRRIVS